MGDECQRERAELLEKAKRDLLDYLRRHVEENRRRLEAETSHRWRSFYAGRLTEAEQTYLWAKREFEKEDAK